MRGRSGAILQHGPLCMVKWQEDGEDCPSAFLFRTAAGADITSVLLHNSARNPQSQTSPFLPLCCKKWLENALAIFSRNARAVVCYYQPYPWLMGVIPFLTCIEPDRNPSLLRGSFHRIL